MPKMCLGFIYPGFGLRRGVENEVESPVRDVNAGSCGAGATTAVQHSAAQHSEWHSNIIVFDRRVVFEGMN